MAAEFELYRDHAREYRWRLQAENNEIIADSRRGTNMKHLATCVTVTLGLVLLGAAPAYGQLWLFPDYAVPSGGDTPTTWIAGSYARGLNDASGETDGISASFRSPPP